MANHRSGGTQLHTKITPDLRHKLDAQIDVARKYAASDCPRTLQDFVVQALWVFLRVNQKRLTEISAKREGKLKATQASILGKPNE